MLSAFYEVVTGREPDMLRAYLLAVLLQMVAVNTMAEFGYLRVAIPPFFGLATVVAGFVFGLGMVLSMGCAGSVFYRAGEGKVDYIYVTIAYAVGAWLSNDWLVAPVHRILHSKGLSTTLHHALTVDRWLLVAIVLVGGILWVIRGPRRPYHGGWDWLRTGLLIGLTGVVAWTASAMTGRPSGLGTMQGSDGLATFFLEWDLSALDWSSFMVVGIPLGSFVASQLHGKSPGKPFNSKRIPLALGGGLLMGVSAAVAAGDNVFHGLGGVPLLAVSSLSFMLFVFTGVWAGVRMNWLR
jgi:hypothetical protein